MPLAPLIIKGREAFFYLKMKAIALLSGGLDSTLAIKVVMEQGIDVVAVNFTSPFCLCNRKNGCRHIAKIIADNFDIKLKMFYVSDEYLEIVRSPKYGYGKNLNPCIDCRILIYKKAALFMKEIGASFVITGEVLGQRPMSQHKAALSIIEKESGLKGLILRPLSAKLLPLTIPEEKGWIDRNRLLDICGRSRKPQMYLANKYDIHEYSCPAGGCLLTDPGFSRRMKDLIEHEGLSLEEINLLKIGRHFRINPKTKLIIGRNEEENKRLITLAKEGDVCFYPIENKGPMAIGRGCLGKEDFFSACRIVARYCDVDKDVKVKIGYHMRSDIGPQEIYVQPMNENVIKKIMV